MHNPAAEAQRWWMQALNDRAFVRAMACEGRFFDKACFNAQQAAEKALKACLSAEDLTSALADLEVVLGAAERFLCARGLSPAPPD